MKVVKIYLMVHSNGSILCIRSLAVEDDKTKKILEEFDQFLAETDDRAKTVEGFNAMKKVAYDIFSGYNFSNKREAVAFALDVIKNAFSLEYPNLMAIWYDKWLFDKTANNVEPNNDIKNIMDLKKFVFAFFDDHDFLSREETLALILDMTKNIWHMEYKYTFDYWYDEWRSTKEDK